MPLRHQCGEADPDLFFADRPRNGGRGNRNREYISIWADDAPGVLRGRSPLQCYEDFMVSFRDNFSQVRMRTTRGSVALHSRVASWGELSATRTAWSASRKTSARPESRGSNSAVSKQLQKGVLVCTAAPSGYTHPANVADRSRLYCTHLHTLLGSLDTLLMRRRQCASRRTSGR